MVEEHRPILALLEVDQVPIEHSTEYHEYRDDLKRWGDRNTNPAAGHVELRFTESQARAYQLLHILPHELGHHHDRLTTRSQRRSARGEPYAEAYANRVADSVFPTYERTFGIWPRYSALDEAPRSIAGIDRRMPRALPPPRAARAIGSARADAAGAV